MYKKTDAALKCAKIKVIIKSDQTQILELNLTH